MVHTVWKEVEADMTFANGDDGYIWAAMDAVEFSIPKDDFIIGDTLKIFKSTDNAVTLVAKGGVTLEKKGAIVSPKFGLVNIEKVGVNHWVAWGDLV